MADEQRKIEMDDIVRIDSLPDGCTAFFTRDGYMACSCGWTDSDANFKKEYDAYEKQRAKVHDMVMTYIMARTTP